MHEGCDSDVRSSVPVVKALFVLVVLGAVGMPTATAAAAANGPQFFQAPTKGIACSYLPADADHAAFLRCDIDGGLKPLPPKPKSCPVDWGLGYEMTKSGRAHPVCAGDTVGSLRGKSLAFGSTWRSGGFTCVLKKKSGLHCTNAKRHGFVLDRKHASTF
jgi:hypothetical protein